MKILACPKCGSKNISMGTIGSGVTFGVTSWKEVCRDCGYQGSPIIFDSEKEYKKFLEELNENKEQKMKTATKKEEDKTLELPRKEKEVIEFLRESEEEIPRKEEKPVEHKSKVWWPEIGLALGITALFYLLGLSNIPFLIGIELAILYGILSFITTFLFLLIAIVIVEYFFKNIKDMLIRWIRRHQQKP